uniref:Uncharacterized protein n=1 Tax=Pongo abelii TaxID=9601 RepID=A0A8I5TJU9_PONAB
MKGKILAKRIHVRTEEHIKHSRSQDSFLKHVKENDQKETEAKEKTTWVQLKRQCAPPREAHCVRTNGKEPGVLEPLPYVITGTLVSRACLTEWGVRIRNCADHRGSGNIDCVLFAN